MNAVSDRASWLPLTVTAIAALASVISAISSCRSSNAAIAQGEISGQALQTTTQQLKLSQEAVADAQVALEKSNKSAELREWQTLTLFDIIRERGISGVKFDDILTKYRSRVTEYKGGSVPAEEQDGKRIRTILLTMINGHSLYYAGDDVYVTQVATVDSLAQMSIRVDEARVKSLVLLQNESGKHTIDEFISNLHNTQMFAEDVSVVAVAELIAGEMIIVGKDAKILCPR